MFLLFRIDNVQGEVEEEFDENEAGLLSTRRAAAHSSGLLDAEDEEADRIYAAIDAHLGERRKTRRERSEAQEDERLKALEPRTGQMFADLKRELGRVSVAEWEALPEVGDFRAKRLKKSGAIEAAKERYLPLPDSAISAPKGINAMITDEGDDEADVLKIGEAKGRLLGQALDSSNIGNASTSIPSMTSMNSISSFTSMTSLNNQMDVGDIKRARQLFASILRTDRKNVPAWLSAVRLEVSAGNLKQARALLVRACEECPRAEDVWMEAVQLAVAEEAGKLLARALKACPNGIKLWLLAASRDPSNHKKIIRAALERNPACGQLWMQLVEAEEEEEDARLLLSRAVDCVPAVEGEELWLALARLQTDHQSARGVLNRALQACPQSLRVWINAARLEEAAGAEVEAISGILARAIERLAPSDTQLLAEARTCEEGGDLVTLRELVNHVSWEAATSKLQDASDDDEAVETVKALLLARLETHPLTGEEWLLLKRLAQPNDELSKIYRSQLCKAPSVQLWIELAAMEGEGVFEEAIIASESSLDREALAAARVRMEFVKQGKSPFLAEAIKQFPQSSVILLERVRIARILGEALPEGLDQCSDERVLLTAAYALTGVARDEFLKGALSRCPTSAGLACLLASNQSTSMARATLERCRLQCQRARVNTGVDQLWIGLCLLEGAKCKLLPDPKYLPFLFTGDTSNAVSSGANRLVLSQALKEVPGSGGLWFLAVGGEARQLRRSKCLEALRRLEGASPQERALLQLALGVVVEETVGLGAAEPEYLKALKMGGARNADIRAILIRKGISVAEGEEDETVVEGDLEGVAFEKFVHEKALYYAKDSAFLEFCRQ